MLKANGKMNFLKNWAWISISNVILVLCFQRTKEQYLRLSSSSWGIKDDVALIQRLERLLVSSFYSAQSVRWPAHPFVVFYSKQPPVYRLFQGSGVCGVPSSVFFKHGRKHGPELGPHQNVMNSL